MNLFPCNQRCDGSCFRYQNQLSCGFIELSFGAMWIVSRIIPIQVLLSRLSQLPLRVNNLLTEAHFKNSVVNFKCRTNSISVLQSTLTHIETLLNSEGPKHTLMCFLSHSHAGHFWSHQAHRMWLRAVSNGNLQRQSMACNDSKPSWWPLFTWGNLTGELLPWD